MYRIYYLKTKGNNKLPLQNLKIIIYYTWINFVIAKAWWEKHTTHYSVHKIMDKHRKASVKLNVNVINFYKENIMK